MQFSSQLSSSEGQSSAIFQGSKQCLPLHAACSCQKQAVSVYAVIDLQWQKSCNLSDTFVSEAPYLQVLV